jgi:hypothetical protein
VCNDNPTDIALIKPYSSDPLFQSLEEIGDDFKVLISKKKNDKINIKLNSRLLITDEYGTLSRCVFCDCSLT